MRFGENAIQFSALILIAWVTCSCGDPVSKSAASNPRPNNPALTPALESTAASRSSSTQSALNPPKSSETTMYLVRLQVWDDTAQKPIPEKSEIWFPGYGSWWLKPATRFGSAVQEMGRIKAGDKGAFSIYADGRSGPEIKVPYVMNPEMNPDGNVRDNIIITISDDSVEIVGLPKKAATGDPTLKVSR